ncbi:MAG: ABC transporter ATP-binding protein, partial [Candidatus Rokuibacteriota bacterium]
LSEQNLRLARPLADRAYIIERGEIRFEGTLAELDADDRIRRACLSV